MVSTLSEEFSSTQAPGNGSAPDGDLAGNDGNNGGDERIAPQGGTAGTDPTNDAEASPDAPGRDDPFAQRLREHETEQRLRWREQVNRWRKEATEDPQIGGGNLPASVARAQLALDRFDEGKRIGQLLEQTGYGNNPDVLRFFNRVADALMEDGLVRGQSGGVMPPLEERMYAGWSSRR